VADQRLVADDPATVGMEDGAPGRGQALGVTYIGR
jgi:hypothetical protein